MRKLQAIDRCFETNSKEAFSYFTHPLYRALKEDFTPYATSMMVHQLIESYKHIASETALQHIFNVKTDRGLIFTVTRTTEPNKGLRCNCPFSILNRLICSHVFCLMNALQIKHLGYCLPEIREAWQDNPAENDPSVKDIIPKNRQAKKMRSFVDKLADKARLRRARHKGGYVPTKMKKVQVEFYDSDADMVDENAGNAEDDKADSDEDDLFDALGDKPTAPKKPEKTEEKVPGKLVKRTVEMYDLMLKQGTKVQAFSRQDEEKLRTKMKLKKLGLNSISELD